MAEKIKDLQYYLAQARRIEEHREAGAEKELRKLYKDMLKDLKQLMSDTYIQYAKDDRLSYAILQEAGYHARFLEEVEQRLNLATPKMQQELRDLVEETYAAAYEAMIKGVMAQGIDGIDLERAQALSITPEQIRAAVENPVSGLTLTDTLEKHRKDIIYNIKQTIGVGLMNGERYSTMANRIVDQVDGDYKKAIRIARTEAHRVREAGNVASTIELDRILQNGTSGLRFVKEWRTKQDERVRPQRAAYKRKPGVKARKKVTAGWRSMLNGPNHVRMHGQLALAEDMFDLMDGHKTIAPGQSGVAGHDINCRCRASSKLMTDEEYFDKTGKHFPGWEEKKKAAETVEKSGNDDIMNLQLFADKTQHATERAAQRNVSDDDIDDALKNPLFKGEVVVDEYGRKSIKYIGSAVTVIWNPDEEKVITNWRTGTRVRKKYGKED